MLKRALFAAILLSSTLAFAGEVSGTWIGALQMDYNTIPKEYREQAKASMAKLKVTMTFKANHTFTSVASGTPDGKSHTSAGTWKQAGSTVTVSTTSYDGKPKTGEQPRQLKVSGDGKTMTMSVQAQSKDNKGKATTPAGSPTVKVVFKKKS